MLWLGLAEAADDEVAGAEVVNAELAGREEPVAVGETAGAARRESLRFERISTVMTVAITSRTTAVAVISALLPKEALWLLLIADPP